MPKWKRSKAVFLVLDDEVVFNLSALLQGRVEPTTKSRLSAFDLVHSKRIPVTEQQLELLAALPSDRWVSQENVDAEGLLDSEIIAPLVVAGLLLTDEESDATLQSRAIEQGLDEFVWHPDALFFHRMSRLKAEEDGEFTALDIGDVASRSDALAKDFVEKVGPPPPVQAHFEDASNPVQLPPAQGDGELMHTLRSRRTVRAFDPQRPLGLQPLSTLLKYTFGCFGDVELTPGVQLLKKTSPSGGALHPIEAFPLILNVEGLASGLYHYDVLKHGLVPHVEYSEEQSRALAQRIGSRQMYVGEAHVVVMLVARFHRNHWKYRQQSRTYSVILMDAGHLSQTFYLMATHLGLGAFFSGAIDAGAVEEALGLNPQEYGPLGICGCGHISPGDEIPNQGSLPFELFEGG